MPRPLPWIKLWTELLSDMKIARLPDWQWRRFAEFLLLAGMNNDAGILQPVDEMAWLLHSAPEKVEDALQCLSKVGVVRQETDGSWRVVNFEKRQASPSKERTERYRERKDWNARHGDGHSDGHSDGSSDSHSTSSSSTSLNDSSSDSLKVSESFKRVARAYEREIGPLTATISDDLQVALEKYPEDYITAALQEAARNNKRSWSYANAICKRWMTDGFQSQNKVNGKVVKVEDKYPVFRAGDKP